MNTSLLSLYVAKEIEKPAGYVTNEEVVTFDTIDAILDITPAKTTTRVINLLGVLLTSFVKQAPINPDPSATPTPIIATSTVPNGANPVKFVTAEVNIYLIPSGLSKLTIDEDISFISFVALSNPV